MIPKPDSLSSWARSFVHGQPPVLFDKLKREHLPVREIKGEPWCLEKNKLIPCGNFWEQTDRILQQMRYRKSGDISFSSFLKQPKLHDFPAQEKARATAYIEGFNAARADKISVNSLVRSQQAEEKIHGDRQFRMVDGYEALVAAVRKRLNPANVPIETNTIVNTVTWSKNQVKIIARCQHQERIYIAPRALITLPLGVLQSKPKQTGAVRFSPLLAEKQRALKQLIMGQVIRVTLRFRECFWDEITPQDASQSLSNMTFLFSQDKIFPTWWTAFPARAPVITAWSASRHAKALIGHPQAFIIREAVAALARVLPVKKKTLKDLLQAAYVHDWQSDPFSRGAYSYVRAGGDKAEQLLAKPLQNTLFFAGEATATDGHYGTVHGAMTSGDRAAQEMLRNL